MTGGDLGAIPVIVGLAIIWTIFQILNPTFLSSANLVNLAMQSAVLGTIALGVVLVLLLAQIDLSVGSLSGLAAAILAVAFTQLNWPLPLAILAALAAGAVFGWFYGFLLTRFGVPSFVITLAGLLGVLGLQLWVLGRLGSINIPFDSWIVQFVQLMFLLFVVLVVGVDFALKRTRWDRSIYAVGGNSEAAAATPTSPRLRRR